MLELKIKSSNEKSLSPKYESENILSPTFMKISKSK